ncbi:P-loop containing nucleoside triphosphate hydrolase protein [Glomus cerebriforme]|uniref:P-loop containing nucleoside triphosphate hydrolase protein n=1 Tax=Glomus cerebriforme TaxID=658196 RepID=A0A397SEN0_9GLOM|nr:P-loop containing nucleoside triphosphate hydrolase protein [Glomus cerebriforme]
MSSIMIQSFRKNMFSYFITHKTLSFQPSKYILRNSNSYLFQSLFSKSYTTNRSEKLKPVSFDLKNEKVLTNSHLYNNNQFLLFLLNKKNIQLKTISDKNYIFRFKDIEELKDIFQPSETHSYYHIIYGKPGVSKTTLVKKVANEIEKGIIYINISPESYNLDDEFRKALNFKFEENSSFLAYMLCKWNFDNSYYKWKQVIDEINYASKIYKKKYKKPPVIIYDNVEYLFHSNPEILNILQENAKNNADNKQYITIFIVNEKDVFDKIGSHHYWAHRHIMEIGNLSKEESIKYLVDNRKIKKEIANKLYELVGGHIMKLKTIADKLLIDGLSFEDIKQQILIENEI